MFLYHSFKNVYIHVCVYVCVCMCMCIYIYIPISLNSTNSLKTDPRNIKYLVWNVALICRFPSE